MINNITFIFSFSAASNSAIFAIESTLTLDPNTLIKQQKYILY